MSTIAIGSSDELTSELMESMHEFRYEVFVRRLKWSLPLLEGAERDQYDEAGAIYLIVRDEDQRVTACARLLPTTGRYMLPELFPQLLGENSPPQHPAIWELSRFATNVRETREGRVLSLSRPTLDLLDSVLELARQHGVKRLVLVTSIAIERLIIRAGFETHRVGPPNRVDGCLCVGLFIEVPLTRGTSAVH